MLTPEPSTRLLKKLTLYSLFLTARCLSAQCLSTPSTRLAFCKAHSPRGPPSQRFARSPGGSLSTRIPCHGTRSLRNCSLRGSLSTRLSKRFPLKGLLSTRIAFIDNHSLRGSLSTRLSKWFALRGSFSKRIIFYKDHSQQGLLSTAWSRQSGLYSMAYTAWPLRARFKSLSLLLISKV